MTDPRPAAVPLAVVGVGCRFPGGVRDLDGLGALLSSGGDAIGAVPPDRWSADFHDPTLDRPGTTSSHVGSFLADIDRFDAGYFGVSPRESQSLDPQQRLLLEVAAEAMSDTGRPRADWRGSRTAVYVGMLASDYTVLHAKTLGPAGIGPHYASGVEFSFAAGRLAYTFDFHGPVATLNSACSSSLLAVHLAAQSLRSGECDTALAGGVNLLMVPELSVFMSRIGAVSPTGQCRPFDTAADGVVRGEGCGLVVLKRLADALDDGDRIYATVDGSAVNHDGFSMGLTVPNGAAQIDLLQRALASGSLDPADVDYVEAHGTGTPLGDQIELSVLADVFGTGRAAGRPLLVGSHKAVFGHTDAAAGIAGLLKAIWIVNSGQAPPQPHLDSPIGAIDWTTAGVAVPTATTAIGAAGRPVRAGVSAFGLSGTNAHIIVSGPPAPALTEPAVAVTDGPYVLLVSSHHEAGLAEQAAGMRARVVEAEEPYGLAELVRSAATRRTHESHRLAVVAGERDGLLDGLAGFPDGSGDALAGAASGGATSAGGTSAGATFVGVADPDTPLKTAFVFSGQGSQWPGMAADLYDSEAVVREALEECDALIRREASWSLVDELRRPRGSRLSDTDIAQPAVFAVQVALSRWFGHAGLTPDAVLGHSVGEVAAAHASGRLPLEDAVTLVVRRGRILHETTGTGRMIAVNGPAETVAAVLADLGPGVVVATVNGPESVVIAGEPEPTLRAARVLAERGLTCLPLPVDYAFHSPVVAHCGPRLRAALADLAPAGAGRIRLLSSVRPLEDLTAPDADYWEHNLTDPVLLWPAVDRLLAEDDYTLVEIGAHPVLARPLADAVRDRGGRGRVISTLRRGEPGPLSLRKAAAGLHVAGAELDWSAVAGRPARYQRLPVPTWGGDRYWLTGVERGAQSGTGAADAAGSAGGAGAAGGTGSAGTAVGTGSAGAAGGTGTAGAGAAGGTGTAGAPVGTVTAVGARISLIGADGSVVGELVAGAAEGATGLVLTVQGPAGQALVSAGAGGPAGPNGPAAQAPASPGAGGPTAPGAAGPNSPAEQAPASPGAGGPAGPNGPAGQTLASPGAGGPTAPGAAGPNGPAGQVLASPGAGGPTAPGDSGLLAGSGAAPATWAAGSHPAAATAGPAPADPAAASAARAVGQGPAGAAPAAAGVAVTPAGVIAGPARAVWPAPGSAVAAAPVGGAAGPALVAAGPGPAAVLTVVDRAVRRVLGLADGAVLPRRRGLFELGLDSLTAVELRKALSAELSVELPSTVVFEHPTVEALARHLGEIAPAAPVTAAPAGTGPAAAEPGATKPPVRGTTTDAAGAADGDPTEAQDDRAVAVVGMACRLPGAGSVEEFWELLLDGGQRTGELPAERRADPSWGEVGPDVPTRGGYLDDVAGFDAAFFRIAPREAQFLDPQQRLLLEVAWESLDDAGLAQQELADRPVGVYVGLNTADYQQLLTRDMRDVDLYYGTGTSFAATAGRLSYALGLRGPSLAVDTACSSSLTAVHLACQALREGDCEVALVGGANVIVAPTVAVAMSAGGALSADGRCKTFDEAADGYGRGEGAAVFVLKPLAAARRDGDRVYAVIAGSAVNQDGASGGMTVPSASAQTAVIRQALRRARWQPADVDYVEAHGTGTPLGDPIEVTALADALGAGRAPSDKVLIGSVKANIGHLEAAAGAAGLLKVILGVHHGEIPRHLVATPSSRIDWARLPVALASRRQDWPATGRPRRAGVSAFGFSGSNAHVLVQQAPEAPARPEPVPPERGRPYVLPVTAATPSALRTAAGLLAARVRSSAPGELAALVHTATRRRSRLDHRLAVVGTDATQLAAHLAEFAAGGTPDSSRQGHTPGGDTTTVGFWYDDVLPTAYPADLREPTGPYAQTLAACAEALGQLTGTPHDLWSPPPTRELHPVHIFSHQVAATRLWSTFGVTPGGVAGRGTGLITAAWSAGRLSLPAALALLTGTEVSAPLAPPRIPLLTPADEPLGDTPAALLRASKPAPAAGTPAAALPGPAKEQPSGSDPLPSASTLLAGGSAGTRAAGEQSIPHDSLLGAFDARIDVLAPVLDARNAAVRAVALGAAELFVGGHQPVWEGAVPAGVPVALPGYPWERRRFWYRELPAAREADPTAGLLFDIAWEQVEEPQISGGDVGTWAVVGDGEAEELAAALGRQGHHVVRLAAGGDWRGRLGELGAAHPDCQGVVVVADAGVLDALAVGRAVAGLARPVGRLWFVTRNAPGAVADEAAVWELGRVLALEMPGRWGGLVDYRPGAADAAVRALGAQRSGRGDDQLRVGPGGPRAARLVRAAATERWRESVEADRCHLVIGGEAAAPAVESLAAQGARRIVWAGGGKVPDLPADVSVELCTVPELAAALGAFDRLGDVIAVATPAATTALADVTPGTVAGHLAQARELAAACELAAGRGPQRITVVISAGPSWGSVSTAAGAAAAGYLAGWADSGRTKVPVGVLGLMPRAGSGELSAEHLALFEQSGLRLLSQDEVRAVLGKVLLAAPGRHSAAAVDLDRYVRLCQELAPRTFLSAFAAAPRAPRQEWVTGLPPAARLDRLVGHTAGTVASVLGLRTGELDPEAGFFDIGMDSVMALGVRSRLEEDLGVELPSTLTFEYPTTVQLAAFLAELLDDGASDAGAPGGSTADGSAPDGSTPDDSGAPDDPSAPPAPATDDDLLLALERQMAAAEDQLDTRTRET